MTMMLQQDIPKLPYHLNAALLVVVLGLTGSDDWPAARVANVFSESGSHFVQIARAERRPPTGYAAAGRSASSAD